jgi:predicted Zn-dependent protease
VDRPLGSVYLALKQPAEATAAFERYLAEKPGDGWTHLQLGKALADGGKAEDAVREYQRALRLDDDLDEAHRLLGMALGRRGDQAQGFYQLGTAALLRGELEQAFSHYERARPILAEGTPQRSEVDAVMTEIEPLLRERARERAAQNRRRGAAPAR